MSGAGWRRSRSVPEGAGWALVLLATTLVLVGAGVSPSRAATAGKAARVEAARETTRVTPGARPQRVIAYYFHTTVRCPSCRAIEAYSREALERAFADELEDGRLVWKVVNLQVKGNEHFVKDFRLYTKSLVLVNEVQGKASEWKNLEKVWQLLRDKPAFLRYVQDETRAFLSSARS